VGFIEVPKAKIFPRSWGNP